MRSRLTVLAPFLIASGLLQGQQPAPAEAREIASRAYTFAYPLILMEYTRRDALARPTQLGMAETNQFTHAQAFPDDRFRQVIRPNADTLYSASWLDLSKEPVLLHVPDTHGRCYLMHLMDAWTESFSIQGKRTTGTVEGWFAITGPGWKGKLPERAQRINAPTDTVWLIGRTQTNNASDYENVHAIQKGFVLMPLSLYPDGPRPGQARPPVRERGDVVPPPAQVRGLSAADYFQLCADLMAKNPPHPEDGPMMQQLARVGIAPGKPFRPEAMGAEAWKAFQEGAAAAAERLAAPPVNSAAREGKNGWSGLGGAVGRYGTNYGARAAVARVGLGALPPEDAVYMTSQQDGGGHDYEGSQGYTLHFAKDQIPPVRAFWSLTMYSDEGYFVPNAIHRYAIGDRDALKFNADGSLDLYVQHDAPGGDRDRNWLPAPEGRFNLALRLYWPREEVLSGRWVPPPVVPSH